MAKEILELLITAENKKAIASLKETARSIDNISTSQAGTTKSLSKLSVGLEGLGNYGKATASSMKDVATSFIGPQALALAATAAIALLAKSLLEESAAAALATSFNEKYSKSLSEATGNTSGEVAQVNALVNAIGNENLSRANRQESLNKLKKQYPEYFAQQGIDIDNTTALKAATDKLSEALLRQAKVQAIVENIKRAETAKSELLNISLKEQIKNLSTLDQVVAFVGGAFKNLGVGASGLAGASGLINKAVNTNNESITALDKVIKTYTTDLNAAVSAQVANGDNLDKGTAKIKEQIKSVKELSLVTAAMWKPVKGTFQADAPDKGLKNAGDVQQRDLKQEAADQAILTAAVNQYALENQNVTYSLGTQFETNKKLFELQTLQSEFIASSLAPAFESFFTTLMSGGDAFQAFIDSLKQMIAKLISALIAALALQLILSALFPSKSAKGAFDFGKVLSMVGGGGLGGLFKKNAVGGIATRATPGIVGEAGPEAIIPLNRLPEMMGSMGGGGAIEVVGKILGSDIILASNRAKQNLNFIG